MISNRINRRNQFHCIHFTQASVMKRMERMAKNRPPGVARHPDARPFEPRLSFSPWHFFLQAV